MESKLLLSQIITLPQHNGSTKVLLGSSKKYQSLPEPGDNYKRPLMVNAWSQTTSDDFGYLNDIEHKEEQSKREKELQEKVRVLEENLRAHSELLSQIHATSAMTSALLVQQQQTQLPSYPKNIQHLKGETQATQFQVVPQHKTPQTSPTFSHSSPPNSVINPLQQVSSNSSDSVKYTIIAEGTGDHNGEPIEIHLAEDDGAINLNSSADSGRLEICLAPDDNEEIKTEFNNTGPGSNHNIHAAATSEHHFIKKLKLAVDQHGVSPTNSSYFFNDKGVLTHSNGNSNYNVPQPSQKPQKQHQKRRSSNSILKTPKVENTGNATTPIQYLMPSPSNSMSSLSGGSGVAQSIGPDNVMVSIGPNNTRIPAKLYENMNWNSASIATRKLLMTIFDRQTLATHSMTGKPSPAFKDHGKPLKQMLDPLVIADIIFAVTRKCNVSDKEVRNAITTKCADENKMMKLQINKRTPMRELNKENVVG